MWRYCGIEFKLFMERKIKMTKNTFIRLLNKDIAPYVTTNNYFDNLGQSLLGIVSVLRSNNIDCDNLLLCNIDQKEGRKCWQIECAGFDSIYLTFCWYKMPSGRYEIIAYFS